MSRLLLLTPQLPYPPEQGTSLRNYNILRGLLGQHRVTLLSFAETLPTAETLERLSGCEEVLTVPQVERGIITRLRRIITDARPDMAHRLQNQAFNSALSGVLEGGGGVGGHSRLRFDLVQIEGIEMAFAIEGIRASTPSTKILFDDHNVEYELQRRAYLADRTIPRRWPAAVYSRIQTDRLRRYERWACNESDHVVAVSDEDRRLLLNLGVQVPISVIPNCIDVEEYARAETDYTDIDLLFVGKMDYRPNVDAALWFAREIWPIVLRRRPESSWTIVGQQPHARLAPVAAQDGVTITGWVEKVQPFLHRSRVFVMPFRVGSGTRLKLVEAMASGRAIVSTTMGAEGYPIRSGVELMLADDPEDFANAIITLLDDPDLRRRLGEQARRFAERYDWRRVSPRFLQVHEEMLAVEDGGYRD